MEVKEYEQILEERLKNKENDYIAEAIKHGRLRTTVKTCLDIIESWEKVRELNDLENIVKELLKEEYGG